MNLETMASLFKQGLFALDVAALVINAGLFPMVDLEIIPAAAAEEPMSSIAEEIDEREFLLQQPVESMDQILDSENEKTQYQFAQVTEMKELLENGPTEEELNQMEEEQQQQQQQMEDMKELWDLTNDGRDALQASVEEEKKRIEKAMAMSTEEVGYF